MSSPEELLEELDAGVLLLTLNRPERNNAWTHELEDRYFERLLAAAADPEVRVIVVTGAGKAFCPGLDMEVLARLAAEGKANRPRYPMTLATRIPKPVICAINGAAAGIGVIQACASDVRFAAAGAKLTTSFARLGLPAEHGVTWMLSRLIGPARAADLLFSSRIVLAEEAAEMGLVNRVLPPDELLPFVLDYARTMAAEVAPSSLAMMKRQIYADLLGSLDEAAGFAYREMVRMVGEADFAEGVAAFQAKRPPKFHPLP